MRILFWVSFSMVFYTYFGYAIFLAILARFRPQPVRRKTISPTVTIVISARNEEQRVTTKLSNLRDLNYPKNRLEIIVVSDGSTDRTSALLENERDFVTAVVLPVPVGKASALNHAVAVATGEILVFFDVRQTVDADAITELVSYFHDDKVGAVSGELILEPSGEGSGAGLGIYWKIEKLVRGFESATGSVVGVTGAIYAIRRELYTDLPADTILDDLLVPMNIARSGQRVVFCPSALAYDQIFIEQSKEFSRKVRTLTGNLQMIQIAPWLLTRQNPLLFRLISHKLLRLAAPLFLSLMLLSSAFVGSRTYAVLFALQLIFYCLALMGEIQASSLKWKPIAMAHTFVFLNLAALLAVRNFFAGRTDVWK